MSKSKPYLIYACYFFLSIALIIFSSYTRELIQWVILLDETVNDALRVVFSHSPLGINLRLILSLVLTPLIIVALPALLYWLIKRKTMPYLIPIVWLFWFITALSRLLSQQGL